MCWRPESSTDAWSLAELRPSRLCWSRSPCCAWPLLAEALYLAETQADGSLLQVLADSYAGRQPDGTYDNSTEANLFINCADDEHRPPVETVRDHGDQAAERSTHFADAFRATTGCIGAPDTIDPLNCMPPWQKIRAV